MSLRITPPEVAAAIEISLPLSKSIANRLLVMSYIAGNSQKIQLPDSNDSLLMCNLLSSLKKGATLFDAEDAGTVFRFLCGLLAIIEGSRTITGSNRMLERPCHPLVQSLRALGAEVEYLRSEGFPPLLIKGRALRGGEIGIDSSVSSQFISALMMIAPTMSEGLIIHLDGKIVSLPYILMTAGLMKKCGIDVLVESEKVCIKPGSYDMNNMQVEADWSAASYWYALVALANSRYEKNHFKIRLKGLNKSSLQGDSDIVQIFQKLGVDTKWDDNALVITNSCRVERNVRFDLTGHPDMAPAIIAVCAGLQLESMLSGLDTLAIKESNRLLALQQELDKLGYDCSVISDNIFITSGKRKPVKSNIIETYNDHRIAMALSVLSMTVGVLIINEPHVVKKSYPTFWDDLRQAGFGIIA